MHFGEQDLAGWLNMMSFTLRLGGFVACPVLLPTTGAMRSGRGAYLRGA
jgi:hypothetical protein